MPRANALRPDFSANDLRRLARRSKDAAQACRLLALAATIFVTPPVRKYLQRTCHGLATVDVESAGLRGRWDAA
jgi:hypothetical protein